MAVKCAHEYPWTLSPNRASGIGVLHPFRSKLSQPSNCRVEEVPVQHHISLVYTDETGESGIKVKLLHGRVDVQVLRYCAVAWWHPSGTDGIVTLLRTVTPAALRWVKDSSGVAEYT